MDVVGEVELRPLIFNGPVEMALRSLSVMTLFFPMALSIQQLVILDYLMVHSDDVDDGPTGIHPQTPYRGGELVVRRDYLLHGLRLLASRGLCISVYDEDGMRYAASDRAGGFLDALTSQYSKNLRVRAGWVQTKFGETTEADLFAYIDENIANWGVEFALVPDIVLEGAS